MDIHRVTDTYTNLGLLNRPPQPGLYENQAAQEEQEPQAQPRPEKPSEPARVTSSFPKETERLDLKAARNMVETMQSRLEGLAGQEFIPAFHDLTQVRLITPRYV